MPGRASLIEGVGGHPSPARLHELGRVVSSHFNFARYYFVLSGAFDLVWARCVSLLRQDWRGIRQAAYSQDQAQVHWRPLFGVIWPQVLGHFPYWIDRAGSAVQGDFVLSAWWCCPQLMIAWCCCESYSGSRRPMDVTSTRTLWWWLKRRWFLRLAWPCCCVLDWSGWYSFSGRVVVSTALAWLKKAQDGDASDKPGSGGGNTVWTSGGGGGGDMGDESDGSDKWARVGIGGGHSGRKRAGRGVDGEGAGNKLGSEGKRMDGGTRGEGKVLCNENTWGKLDDAMIGQCMCYPEMTVPGQTSFFWLLAVWQRLCEVGRANEVLVVRGSIEIDGRPWYGLRWSAGVVSVGQGSGECVDAKPMGKVEGARRRRGKRRSMGRWRGGGDKTVWTSDECEGGDTGMGGGGNGLGITLGSSRKRAGRGAGGEDVDGAGTGNELGSRGGVRGVGDKDAGNKSGGNVPVVQVGSGNDGEGVGESGSIPTRTSINVNSKWL
ncbi:hypothetical protein EDB83DRAFT_2643552 [Lactarius deliciosus]|nr:hypothetical protein EDB83DRAFT_2643552 [Lactarius deliciosus]